MSRAGWRPRACPHPAAGPPRTEARRQRLAGRL